MHFLEAEKILKVAYDKILEEFLYKRYLVELPYMDQNNFLTFEEYKQKIFELTRLKNRTKKEKEEDLKQSRKIAAAAIKKLDENRDFHKERYKSKKQKTSKFIK
jgi:hypothetical protein